MSTLYIDKDSRAKQQYDEPKLRVFDSLENQFTRIQPKLLSTTVEIQNLDQLLQLCLPKTDNSFYLSLPSFDRSLDSYGAGRQDVEFLRNVVIRPEKTILINSIIPQDLDILFFGDIKLTKGNYLELKGFQLIDASIEKYGEYKIECNVDLSSRMAIGQNRMAIVNSVFSRDLVLDLMSIYPVPDYESVIEYIETFKEYLHFRDIHLTNQSKTPLDFEELPVARRVGVMKSQDFHKLNKKDKNFSYTLLDGHKFTNKYNVLLDEDSLTDDFKSDASDQLEFIDLVTACIEKTRSELQQDMVTKKNNQKVEEADKAIREKYGNLLSNEIDDLTQQIEALQSDTQNITQQQNTAIEHAVSDIDIEQIIDDVAEIRLEAEMSVQQKQLDQALNEELTKLSNNLKNEYGRQQTAEIDAMKKDFEAEKSDEINNRLASGGSVRYYIYYKISTEKNAVSMQNSIDNLKPNQFKYNISAEKAKIDRQRNAIRSLEQGCFTAR
ncbi:MAG: hypothetical protein ATN35_05970 [Epulopiscium sp. Nele67-Bin004]|nr:MAG: hypothetical protein ATN35_05970 [Epulopiscium sp. Nele67-Bin004]